MGGEEEHGWTGGQRPGQGKTDGSNKITHRSRAPLPSRLTLDDDWERPSRPPGPPGPPPGPSPGPKDHHTHQLTCADGSPVPKQAHQFLPLPPAHFEHLFLRHQRRFVRCLVALFALFLPCCPVPLSFFSRSLTICYILLLLLLYHNLHPAAQFGALS